MTWFNRDEVEDTADFWKPGRHEYPNTYRASQVLLSLMRWTNSHSDGWHMWAPPGNAADKLTVALREQFNDFRDDGCRSHVVDGKNEVVKFKDLSDAQLKALLTPIKSFLTKVSKQQYGRIDLPDEDRATILDAGIPPDPAVVRRDVLDEIVHDTASQIASNVNNTGEHEDWLLSQGWTQEQIEEEITRRTKEHA